MNKMEIWKNFDLGTELDVSGCFIYNGLKSLHEIETLHYSSDIFEILYNLSVGIERLLKINIILIEHNDNTNLEEFEKSLITHNTMELLARVQKNKKLPISNIHNDFIQMLSKFYKSYRYDRYSPVSGTDIDKEKKSLHAFIEKNLNFKIHDTFPFEITHIDIKLKKSFGKVVGKIVSSLYDILQDEARRLNLYTYEVRYNSKAGKIFIRKEYNFENEDVLSKELLIFFINTKERASHLNLIHDIDHLDFDPALETDYIQSMNSFEKKLVILDELESLYEDIDKPGDRLSLINAIGSPGVEFETIDNRNFEV